MTSAEESEITSDTTEHTKDTGEKTPDSLSRRSLLTQVAVAGIGVGVLGLAASTATVHASTTPQQPAAETGHDYPMARPNAKNEKQYRVGVLGPAMLSLVTSQIAVDKATDPATKEFANFELREAIAVTTVLKSLNTPPPPMDANAKATLAKIKAAPKGAAFDKAYITAQLANHEFLRDLTTSYLTNTAGKTSMAEMHGRHLATLAQSTFKEHVVHTKNILQAMKV